MHANMPNSHSVGQLDPVTAAFARGARQAAAIEDGTALIDAALRLAARLGSGPVLLLARNSHAAALAAACAVVRAPQKTTWQIFHVGRSGYEIPNREGVVIIEPAELGAGLREALVRMYPDVTVIDGLAEAPRSLREAV